MINAEGNTPLHWASLNGQTDAARVLLQAGASASALNRYEETPVDAALSRDHQHVVDLINEFNPRSEEVDDIPDDADEVKGDDADMELEPAPSA